MGTTFTHTQKLPRASRWIAVAALVFVAFLINEVVGHTGYFSRREQVLRIQKLSNQVDQLKRENQDLTQRIHDLRSDPSAIEEMAREQLHLGRPGEVIVALPPKQPPQTSEQ